MRPLREAEIGHENLVSLLHAHAQGLHNTIFARPSRHATDTTVQYTKFNDRGKTAEANCFADPLYARAYEAWAALGGQATPKMRHIIQSCRPEG